MVEDQIEEILKLNFESGLYKTGELKEQDELIIALGYASDVARLASFDGLDEIEGVIGPTARHMINACNLCYWKKIKVASCNERNISIDLIDLLSVLCEQISYSIRGSATFDEYCNMLGLLDLVAEKSGTTLESCLDREVDKLKFFKSQTK